MIPMDHRFHMQRLRNVVLLFALTNHDRSFYVSGIKCFVCDNQGPHLEDKVLVAHTAWQANSKCHQYADVSELKIFTADCPAESNACQSAVGWISDPKNDHSYRGCVAVSSADRDSQNRHCRNHPTVANVYSCPCYQDYCNFHNTLDRDSNGNTVGGLSSNITDKENLAGTTTKAPSGSGGGGGGDTNLDIGGSGSAGGAGEGEKPAEKPADGSQSGISDQTGGASTSKLSVIPMALTPTIVLIAHVHL